MKIKYLIFLKVGLVFIGIIAVFSFKAWAIGTLIPLSSATYNKSDVDYARGVVVDGSGNIIVTGIISWLTNPDYFTIKYNNNLSIVLASASYNGPLNNADFAYGVVVDGVGNIIVAGRRSNGVQCDYFTIKYNDDLSLVLGSATYSGAANGCDHAYGIAIDGAGNIIVTGCSDNGANNDYFTIKYNNDLSVVLGSAAYDSPVNSHDNAYGVVVDGAGNIIVTGGSNNGANFDYFTIKYNSDLSVVLGSATYNGPANQNDYAWEVTVDTGDNIIVTGQSDNGSNNDYFTIKYNSDLSVVLGSVTYNGPANNNDYAYGIIVDGAGNIIVVGHSNNDYFTLKYNNDLSIVLASATYNGPANGDDGARAVTLDGAGNIIITGHSSNGVDDDYFTIKYNGPPQILSLVPSFGQPGETLEVIINGLNFYAGAGILFSDSGITLNTLNFINVTQLSANISIYDDALLGIRDVTVTNIDEATGILAGGFEIRENISYQENDDFRLVRVYPKIITPNQDGINDVATFIFENPNNEEVKGMIFNLSGSVVRDALVQNSDTSLIWNGRDNNGNIVSGKVYIYQIKAGGKLFNGTVVLAK